MRYETQSKQAQQPDATVAAINMNEAVAWFVTQAQAGLRRG
jgi:hypothetical protein